MAMASTISNETQVNDSINADTTSQFSTMQNVVFFAKPVSESRIDHEDEEECMICTLSLSELAGEGAQGIAWHKVGCNRAFHRGCIAEWDTSCQERKVATTCPNCRGLLREAPVSNACGGMFETVVHRLLAIRVSLPQASFAASLAAAYEGREEELREIVESLQAIYQRVGRMAEVINDATNEDFEEYEEDSDDPPY